MQEVLKKLDNLREEIVENRVKITETAGEVIEIRSHLEAVLPHLASKTDVLNEIQKHSDRCAKQNGKGLTKKMIGALVTAVIALSGAVAAIVQMWSG